MAPKILRPGDGWPLAKAVAMLGGALKEDAASRLTVWLDLLITWNARVDLTAARSSDELVDLMVADAAVLASRVPEGARVIDVGTGAGAPGLALALLRPDLELTLVEPLAKRAAFLRTVVGTLRLSRVSVETKRGEDLEAARARWDVALARATLPPPAWLALAATLVPVGGAAWVFLAKEQSPDHAAFTARDEVPYVWPLTGAARRLVRYERTTGGALPGG